MANKLYTEEQVRKAIDLAKAGKTMKLMWSEIKEYDYSTDEILNSLNPIELPSDEEIEKARPITLNPQITQDLIWMIGAKWLKEQILNQNK